MESGTKQTLIKGTVIVVILGTIALLTKNIVSKIIRKREKAREDELNISLGQTQTSQEQQEEAASSSYSPTADVGQIAKYILGANFSDYPDQISSIFNRLTDAELGKLADAWKKKYGRTLYYDLDDEWDSCGAWGFSDCYVAHKGRLAKIGKS
jgi:hypothetical protein